MKNKKRFFALAAMVAIGFSSCKKDDDDTGVNTNKGGLIELTGDLDNMTLTKSEKYLLKGQVFVREGKTLSIEPGTVIFGDKRTRGTLVIDKGGVILAEGTVGEPIVFTSNQEAGVRDRGDWGGLVILGTANVNQNNPAIEGITPEVNFGSTNSTANDNESSGVLRYVRVEFGGIELTPNNETNSITMGGVGRGTTMEYCMTSFGGDDNFEWFGGTVNAKHFVSLATWDDDFDCDYGWSGNLQYGLAVRYPGFADQSESNAFECDNGPNDNDVEPYTTGTFSNVTVFGPIRTGNRVSNNNFAHAMDLRRRTGVSILNSVFAGYPRGLRMNQPSVYENYTSKNIGVLANNIMVAPNADNKFRAGSGVDVANVQSYWENNNTVIDGPQNEGELNIYTDLGLNPNLFYGPTQLASDYPKNPNFALSNGTLTNGADFSNPKFNENNRSDFFDTNVNFIGGFGSENWIAGWTEFDPVNKEY